MWQNIRGDLLFRRHAITVLPDPNSVSLRCLSTALQRCDFLVDTWFGMHPLSGCLPQCFIPLTACKRRLRLADVVSAYSSHLPSSTYLPKRYYPCGSISNVSSWRVTWLLVSSVTQWTRNESILSAFFHRPFPRSYSSSGTAAAQNTPHVPPTTHGLPPQRDRSILRRKPSRLCIHLKTNFGVRFVRSHYFSYKVPRTRETVGINRKLSLPIFKIQNSVPVQNSKLLLESAMFAGAWISKFKIIPLTLGITSAQVAIFGITLFV